MSDKSAAYLFSQIFELLASGEALNRNTLAFRFWELSQEYDFHPSDMECDEALAKLGLTRKPE